MKRILFGLFLLGGWTASMAFATTTRAFRQTTAKDFAEGEATASQILPSGDVVSGMVATRLPLDAAFAWCGLSDGPKAYFGTGDEGRVVSLAADGKGRVTTLAQLGVPWVTALQKGEEGSLLAGSTPGGRIFTISERTGKSQVLAKLPAEHIWALLYDRARRETIAATGDSGKLFTIQAQGGHRLLWDSGDKHILSLAQDGDAILAGTADKAIAYRVFRDGRYQVLHDFDADEVRAILRLPEAILLAVNDFETPPDLTPALGPKTGNGTRVSAPPTPAANSKSTGDQVKARSAVYRLENDGRIEQVFALDDGYLTAMEADEQGNVLIASGTTGKLYRLAPDRKVSVVVDLPERQALSLVRTKTGFLMGSGDMGGIYAIAEAKGSQATYLSKVFDADGPSRFGHLWWDGTADLRIETRSGNTGKPDASWSPFVAVQSPKRHSNQWEGKITSPGARYLQYRVILPGEKSTLHEIVIYHLPHNQRARITEVYLADAPDVIPSVVAPATVSPAASRVHSPLLKLRWRVENPDGDELLHRLFFREVSEAVFRPLGNKEEITKPEFDWNTESVADGRYVFRVWVSDEKVTPANAALDFTFESPPFLVDNTQPEIVKIERKGRLITGQATDAASNITAIEYAVDGEEWKPVQPDDGLLDQRSERFTLVLSPGLVLGPHVINVRAFDESDNQGTGRIEIRAPR